MKIENNMGKAAFVIEHIYWVIIAMLWYKNILLRCIANLTFRESRFVLWTLIIVSCIIGICTAMKRRRNWKSVAQNIIIPFGIYTVFAYLPIQKTLIVAVLAISASLFMAYTLLVMLRKIKSKQRFFKILKRRFGRVIRGGYAIFSIGFAVLVGGLGGNILLGSTIMQASGAKNNFEAEDTIANHMETLTKLQEETWETLTVQEKLDVLQVVAGIERNYLGLSNELNVGTANLQEGLLGFYKDETHEIVLSLEHVMYSSSWSLVQTLCHEAYHSYQFRVVEVYNSVDVNSKNLIIFNNAESYAEEFENYVDGYDDYFVYAAQECESDARAYAEEALYEYYTRIVGPIEQ